MPGIALATEQGILALVFSATTWAGYAVNATATPQTTILVSLNTGDPGIAAGTMATSEISYTGYARIPVARGSGWSTPTGAPPASVSPLAVITFGASTGGTGGSVTNFATGSAGTVPVAGTMLWTGIVTPNITVNSGVTPSLTTATTISLT